MEKVIVLGLSGCKYCDDLKESLSKNGISYKFVDAERNTTLADRMEALLKTEHYPMVILEEVGGAVYFYKEDSYEKAIKTSIGYASKIGCVSTESMVEQIKKHLK
jgi:glutaredoxin